MGCGGDSEEHESYAPHKLMWPPAGAEVSVEQDNCESACDDGRSQRKDRQDGKNWHGTLRSKLLNRAVGRVAALLRGQCAL